MGPPANKIISLPLMYVSLCKWHNILNKNKETQFW